ncbi:DNA polymerase III subunit delta' [Porphyromonas sp.]|uniref:DNA polymerase III subunit n=1 Tax=Porphyromonas sp. TaxID=1924944 RepID=UPI0026DAEF2B|nr:DNA polymerase III subunit delta' [Porphyromonas sp.]MDO4695372.1 hypothetical protein [Porphyromonas sp.]MDO4770373.1 hypothetical protein [Porphyromonas sp.]
MIDGRLTPFFRDILGQEVLIGRLREYVVEENIPHALLFVGEDGGEALPLALAFTRYLQCESPTHGDACGRCRACLQMDALAHPDVFPIFPVTKIDSNDKPTSVDRLDEYRSMLSKEQRPLFSDWKVMLKSENRQPQMYISEAEYLQHKLSYKSFQSKYRVVLVWLPELMNTPCANTLLKLLEEPPQGVLFIMVSADPSSILPTIYSRLQRIRTLPVHQNKIERFVAENFGVSSSAAAEIAHLTQGNLRRALDLLKADSNNDYFFKFQEACKILYLPIKGDPKLMKEKSEAIHKLQRSEAIELLDIMMDVIREVNAYTHGENECRYIRSEETDIVRQLSNFQSLNMIPKMMEMIMTARAELAQNAMTKIVFFDLLVSLSLVFRGK